MKPQIRIAIPAAVAAALLAGAVHAGEIVIHKQPNFSGGALTLRDDKSNLANTGFQDQASSIEVRSGKWQVCSQPEYNGDCMILYRGKYASLDQKINHRIESVRELPVVAENTPPRRVDRDDRYAREREREERYYRERAREERYSEDRDRYSSRYSDDRYTSSGSRW